MPKHTITGRQIYKQGQLTAMPELKAPGGDVKPGIQPLALGGDRDGLIYVPQGYTNQKPGILAVMLHGAGGMAEHGLQLLRSYADEHQIILLAPASRRGTWDIIASDSFGDDVIFVDQALSHVFSRYAVDPARITIGGFSDGASYALCLGLSNGLLFKHVLAFSPGFYFTKKTAGKPSIFISHGTNDHILPIDPCSRRIVPALKRHGYDVNYVEFQGEHEIPPFVSASAVEWLQK
jgi:phospholipase/carboxylesterase